MTTGAQPAPYRISLTFEKKTGLILLDQMRADAAPTEDSLAIARAELAKLRDTELQANELEERLGIMIEDDEVDGEMLETFGALVRFAEAKAIGV